MTTRTPGGLTAQIKETLIKQSLRKRLAQAQNLDEPPPQARQLAQGGAVPEAFTRFSLHPGYQQLRLMAEGGKRLGVESPFFKVHESMAGATTKIDGREFINYANYNYLGYANDARVIEAAKDALDRYGTTVSASRPVAGERPVHRELEREIADLYGTEDSVALVSGHATNVTTIGYLFGPRDLIVHDELVHNSVLQGIQLSGAKRLPFPHNDWQALDRLLTAQRRDFERVLVVVEGIYSMDGDYPDLPQFVALRSRHGVFLMVDEAHSLGVMGAGGGGIREHFGLRADDVDIWMGTLSKSLAGCGGFIAGESALVEHLKFLAPGFLYSVGMPPPVAAASLAALRLMRQEPQRVQALQSRGQRFLARARAAGIDTGASTGLAVVPAITGNSLAAVRLSQSLFEEGIHVQPILHPAVPEKSARLRFFLNHDHTDAQIDATVDRLAAGLRT